MPFILSFCRFHLFRLYYAQPRAAIALVTSATLLVLVSLLAAAQWEREQTALRTLDSERTHPAEAGPTADPALQQRSTIPDFDSAKLVAALHETADAAKLPVDEISYTLDENASQPYLRYRVRLNVVSSYPVIRRFVDQFRGELAHVALDSITCNRSDITDADLSCDLVLSAFYRKPGRG
jgi:hypothetical protein